MKKRCCSFPLFSLLLLTLWAASAEAQIEPLFGQRTGYVLEGSFGVNGVTDDDYVEDHPLFVGSDVAIGPIVGLGVGFYYRPLPFLSAGGFMHYGFLNPKAVGYNDEVGGFFAMLAEVRGHYPIKRFDPWVGFGLGYAVTFSAADYWADTYGGDASLTLHGVGITLGTGVQIFLTERIAINPFFRMIFGGWPTACIVNDGPGSTLDRDECDDVDDIYNDADRVDDWPHLWLVGVAANYII
jgi:hypothetical protein